jgi:hypothetical protein
MLQNTGGGGETFLVVAVDGVWRTWQQGIPFITLPLPVADGGTGASTVDGARAALSFPAVTNLPRRVDWATKTFTTTDVVGTGSASTTLGGLFDLRTGATPGSRVRYCINSDGIPLTNSVINFANWTKRIVISCQLKYSTMTIGHTFRLLVGKRPLEAYGLATNGDYVGFTQVDNTTAQGFVCVGGTVTTVALTPANYSFTTGLNMVIIADNGNVSWWVGGVLLGQTASGPTTESGLGTVNLELESTTANEILQMTVESEAY